MQKACKIQDEILKLLKRKKGEVLVADMNDLRMQLNVRGYPVDKLEQEVRMMRNNRLIKLKRLRDKNMTRMRLKQFVPERQRLVAA